MSIIWMYKMNLRISQMKFWCKWLSSKTCISQCSISPAAQVCIWLCAYCRGCWWFQSLWQLQLWLDHWSCSPSWPFLLLWCWQWSEWACSVQHLGGGRDWIEFTRKTTTMLPKRRGICQTNKDEIRFFFIYLFIEIIKPETCFSKRSGLTSATESWSFCLDFAGIMRRIHLDPDWCHWYSLNNTKSKRVTSSWRVVRKLPLTLLRQTKITWSANRTMMV